MVGGEAHESLGHGLFHMCGTPHALRFPGGTWMRDTVRLRRKELCWTWCACSPSLLQWRLRQAGLAPGQPGLYSTEFQASLSDLGSPGHKEKSEKRPGCGICKPGLSPQDIKTTKRNPTRVVPSSTPPAPHTRVSWGQPQSSLFWGACGVWGCWAWAYTKHALNH